MAGTEKGLGSEPEATLSTCFGAPFLPLNPRVYADLLGSYILKNNSAVWLINTGWTGGPYGIGERIRLPYTRAMIKAALGHRLDGIAMRKEPFFGLMVPESCPDVPAEALNPVKTWKDPAAYLLQANKLVTAFEINFRQFEGVVSKESAGAGPHNNF